MSEGYFDKMDSLAQMIRIGSYRIHQSLVKKPLKIEDFWPLWGDKKHASEKFVMSREMYAEIKKAHNLN
jgi:hypothetical protein